MKRVNGRWDQNDKQLKRFAPNPYAAINGNSVSQILSYSSTVEFVSPMIEADDSIDKQITWFRFLYKELCLLISDK